MEKMLPAGRIFSWLGADHLRPGQEDPQNALVDQQPDKIFFIGSQAVGKRIMSRAAEHLIPVELELGGKDPMIRI